MQYHYVVGYDTEMNKWFVELDTTAYFSDGNIWSQENIDRFGFGWSYPENDEETLDQTLVNTLQYIVDTFPIPQEAS